MNLYYTTRFYTIAIERKSGQSGADNSDFPLTNADERGTNPILQSWRSSTLATQQFQVDFTELDDPLILMLGVNFGWVHVEHVTVARFDAFIAESTYDSTLQRRYVLLPQDLGLASNIRFTIGTTIQGVAVLDDRFYYLNDSHNELWSAADVRTLALTRHGDLPSGLTERRGMCEHDGNLFFIDTATRELYEITDTTNPSGASLVMTLPSAWANVEALASADDKLWAVDKTDRRLGEFNSALTSITNQGAFSSTYTTIEALAGVGDDLYALNRSDDRALLAVNKSTPSSSTRSGYVPEAAGDIKAMTFWNGKLYGVDSETGNVWVIPVSLPSTAEKVGNLIHTNEPRRSVDADYFEIGVLLVVDKSELRPIPQGFLEGADLEFRDPTLDFWTIGDSIW